MDLSYGIMCRRNRQKKPPLTSHHSSGVHPALVDPLLFLLSRGILSPLVVPSKAGECIGRGILKGVAPFG